MTQKKAGSQGVQAKKMCAFLDFTHTRRENAELEAERWTAMQDLVELQRSGFPVVWP